MSDERDLVAEDEDVEKTDDEDFEGHEMTSDAYDDGESPKAYDDGESPKAYDDGE